MVTTFVVFRVQSYGEIANRAILKNEGFALSASKKVVQNRLIIFRYW